MKKKKHIPQIKFNTESTSGSNQQTIGKDIKNIGKIAGKNQGPANTSGLRKSQRKG